MIDPLIALASSMESSPGVYALLLGSGVSRGAQIPTGWEVTLDLVKRLAVGEDPEGKPPTDPISWYRERFGTEPDYGSILETLAASPADRRSLLGQYFEPSTEERARGAKVPSEAHRAIADLVAEGYVRVLLTTNFDRLVEVALGEAGVSPVVLSSPDDIKGAVSLAHTSCTVVKVHGDYLDERIKNTDDELAAYDELLDSLLDKILDEYGLVVCGWSGDYDVALSAAIRRAPSRRYTLYWTSKGEPRDTAKQLIAQRDGKVILIDDANSLFKELREKIRSIHKLRAPDPLSAALAAESIKANLANPLKRIEVDDLAGRETERLVASHRDLEPSRRIEPDQYLDRIRRLEALTEICMWIAAVGAYWGESSHYRTWARLLQRVLNHPHKEPGSPSPDLDRYPAFLLLYVCGVGAVAGQREELLWHLAQTVHWREGTRRSPLLDVLATWDVLDHYVLKGVFRVPETNQEWIIPSAELLVRSIRDALRQVIPSDDDYLDAFCRFEYLMALLSADAGIGFPPGKFLFRWPIHVDEPEKSGLAGGISGELSTMGSDWPLLRAGAFQGQLERLQEAKKTVDERSEELAKRVQLFRRL